MKKNNNKGFMLAETLIVTTFVAGVLIFLFMQLTRLSGSYEESYNYNNTESLYALEDVKNYIESDAALLEYVNSNIDSLKYIDITDCSLAFDKQYCLKLFQLENIKQIIITKNLVPFDEISGYDEDFMSFINKVNSEGEETYRLIASFNNSRYATLRFGDNNE